MAILHLQRDATAGDVAPVLESAPAAASEAAEAWMGIDAAGLEEWAGRAALRAGLLRASECPPEVERAGVVRVRFPQRNTEVRFIPGAGLGGAIVSGAAESDDKAWIAAAVIQVQRAAGREWTLPLASTAPANPGDPARSRVEIIEACRGVARDLVGQGLSRPSASMAERCLTLAMSALGVHLPRLSLLMRAIADDVEGLLARDARGDAARLLARLAECEALCSALALGGEFPRADLVGTYRRRFDEVGSVELAGVAAWPWTTPSGHVGLTVLFRDAGSGAWNTWSESRAKTALAGFDPEARFDGPAPWDGADSPRQLARSRFRLLQARRSADGRLSGSGQSRALVLGSVDLVAAGVPILDDVSGLPSIWSRSTVAGLRPADPLARIVVIRVARPGARGFDPVRQVFQWELWDSRGGSVLLELPFEPRLEPAIQLLEGWDPASMSGSIVVGRLDRTASGLVMFPYTIHGPGGAPVHLGLFRTGAPGQGVAGTISPAGGTEEPDAETGWDRVGEAVCSVPLARLLDAVDDALLAAAEGGILSRGQAALSTLPALVAACRNAGLERMANGLGRMLGPGDVATALLRAVHVTEVLRRLGMHRLDPGPGWPDNDGR